jgi:hypothetical protein
MAFTFAYSLDNAVSPAQDFALTAPATYTPAFGDVVRFDANGTIVAKHVVGDSASSKLGVAVGTNFTGLAQGGTYAATTVSTYAPSTLGKVYIDPNAVYRVNISSATAIAIGTPYGITTVSGDQQLDPSATSANNEFMVVDFDRTAVAGAPFGWAFVTIQSANRLFG